MKALSGASGLKDGEPGWREAAGEAGDFGTETSGGGRLSARRGDGSRTPFRGADGCHEAAGGEAAGRGLAARRGLFVGTASCRGLFAMVTCRGFLEAAAAGPATFFGAAVDGI